MEQVIVNKDNQVIAFNEGATMLIKMYENDGCDINTFKSAVINYFNKRVYIKESNNFADILTLAISMNAWNAVEAMVTFIGFDHVFALFYIDIYLNYDNINELDLVRVAKIRDRIVETIALKDKNNNHLHFN